MKLVEKLNLALGLGQIPPLKNPTAYRKIGAGAWHDAYLVYPQDSDRLVIRLRKQVIYGQTEIFDEKSLHEDYAGVGLFYAQANRGWPGICPTVYHYHISPKLSFTIESYMGPALSLDRLTERQAYVYGQQVGQAFREIYALPAPVVGFGELVWQGQGLIGQESQTISDLWQMEAETYHTWFEALGQSEYAFDRDQVKSKLADALTQCRFDQEPITLVNGDITPENLITRQGHFTGLIDPVPRLHNGLRYAAFFAYCYRSYLPNLADAPRYAHHHFGDYRLILMVLVEGYINGYTNNDSSLKEKLALEYFLWAVDVAYENLQRLQAEMTSELYLRAGDKKMITARLRRCLRELEDLAK